MFALVEAKLEVAEAERAEILPDTAVMDCSMVEISDWMVRMFASAAVSCELTAVISSFTVVNEVSTADWNDVI